MGSDVAAVSLRQSAIENLTVVMRLWRIVVGTERQAEDIKERVVEFASANPAAAKEVAEAALDFEPDVTLSRFEGRGLDGLIDMVVEERDPLDDLFDEMKRPFERYESLQTRFALMADAPRRAYRRTSEVVLGRKVWGLIAEECGNSFPGSLLVDLVDRNDVPWESLIHTDRPEVRDAILRLAEAIGPELRAYRFVEDE